MDQARTVVDLPVYPDRMVGDLFSVYPDRRGEEALLLQVCQGGVGLTGQSTFENISSWGGCLYWND